MSEFQPLPHPTFTFFQIIECHKRIRASRLKRTPITKQERDEVYRLTEEQRRLSDQLAATRKLPAD